MVKITETKDISEYEKKKLKKEEDFLMVGKSDKTVSVVSGGETIPIKELAVAARTGTTEGYLEIPTAEGIPFVYQYGVVEVEAGATITVKFPKAFTNRCFKTNGSATNNVLDPTVIKTSGGTLTDFTISSIGGTVKNIVRWDAVGF